MSNALTASRFVYEGSPHQAAFSLLDACCSLQNLAFTIAGRRKPLLIGPDSREVPEAKALDYLRAQSSGLIWKRLRNLGRYYEEVRPRLASSLAALEPFAQVAKIGWGAGMSAHHAVLMLAAQLLALDARGVDEVLNFLLSQPPIDEVMAKLLLTKEHNALLATATTTAPAHVSPTIPTELDDLPAGLRKLLSYLLSHPGVDVKTVTNAMKYTDNSHTYTQLDRLRKASRRLLRHHPIRLECPVTKGRITCQIIEKTTKL
jgi:hypothetical protein